jgi:uncharacterized protein (DUF488 family)
MEIHTIGFAGRTAADFFETLKKARIARLVDVRLNNKSQLAGFTKRGDLPYLLREICGSDYVHEPRLAPTAAMLEAYRKKRGAWSDYERAFRRLLRQRKIEKAIDPGLFAVPAVLLCSEREPEHCHRRLVAEHLRHAWGPDIVIRHF